MDLGGEGQMENKQEYSHSLHYLSEGKKMDLINTHSSRSDNFDLV